MDYLTLYEQLSQLVFVSNRSPDARLDIETCYTNGECQRIIIEDSNYTDEFERFRPAMERLHAIKEPGLEPYHFSFIPGHNVAYYILYETPESIIAFAKVVDVDYYKNTFDPFTFLAIGGMIHGHGLMLTSVTSRDESYKGFVHHLVPWVYETAETNGFDHVLIQCRMDRPHLWDKIYKREGFFLVNYVPSGMCGDVFGKDRPAMFIMRKLCDNVIKGKFLIEEDRYPTDEEFHRIFRNLQMNIFYRVSNETYPLDSIFSANPAKPMATGHVSSGSSTGSHMFQAYILEALTSLVVVFYEKGSTYQLTPNQDFKMDKEVPESASQFRLHAGSKKPVRRPYYPACAPLSIYKLYEVVGPKEPNDPLLWMNDTVCMHPSKKTEDHKMIMYILFADMFKGTNMSHSADKDSDDKIVQTTIDYFNACVRPYLEPVDIPGYETFYPDETDLLDDLIGSLQNLFNFHNKEERRKAFENLEIKESFLALHTALNRRCTFPRGRLNKKE